MVKILWSCEAEFQSTLPQGERLRTKSNIPFDLQFQSTLPQGERPYPSMQKGGYILISIHAPTRGATTYVRYYPQRRRISIHAPTRGATEEHRVKFVSIKISIHAPTRGATLVAFVAMYGWEFQSTLPQGERLSGKLIYCPLRRISIHAPTRGATNWRWVYMEVQ